MERRMQSHTVQGLRKEFLDELDKLVCGSKSPAKAYKDAAESSAAAKKVCGYVFKDGDFAYYSKAYAADSTCIIC